jgi:hypothetical protein
MSVKRKYSWHHIYEKQTFIQDIHRYIYCEVICIHLVFFALMYKVFGMLFLSLILQISKPLPDKMAFIVYLTVHLISRFWTVF